jgi:hypothetical protein
MKKAAPLRQKGNAAKRPPEPTERLPAFAHLWIAKPAAP